MNKKLFNNIDENYISIFKSSIGTIKIEANENEIIKIELMKEFSFQDEKPNQISLKCKQQLEEYFEGKRKIFNIEYKLIGTEFQCNVWKELAKIPYGLTVSYKDIANRIKNPKSVRAVANAIGKNNLLILIPCHRVIGSNGKLTGFSAETEEKSGLEIKKELLELEKNNNKDNLII